ncbi:head maturation protease, ClpP-related [Bradyrhizobium sp. S3.9.1]|uniref:head maturation protease, ClpP-related n=1 Tax=Bradyrhizobium sp. S3.9.1 TaxID=3156431 RepID=UPI0033959742
MRQWFTMKAEDKTAEIVIYDEIGKSWWGEDTVSAKQFLDDLTALGDVDAITLRVNSPGGDVFDGVAIHNSLKNHKATVTAHVDGIAASAASFIVMAADKVVMPSNAFLLIHGASGLSWGNADDMRAVADDLDRIDQSLTATYVARAKSTTAKVKALMKEDRLMDATEAKQWGFADEVTSEKKMAANFSLRLLPKAAADAFRLQSGSGEGDPPSPAPAPEAPEVPPAPPAPVQEPSAPAPVVTEPAAKSAEIIILEAKQQGIEEHRVYVASVTDLCKLAQQPERVGGYVRANTPIEQVRKELLEVRAQETVMPQHPLAPPGPPASAWEKITDKLNARFRK